MQLEGWHVNEVPVYLTLRTALNKLVTIRLHGQPEIVDPYDLASQQMSFHMWSVDSRMNLSYHSISGGTV